MLPIVKLLLPLVVYLTIISLLSFSLGDTTPSPSSEIRDFVHMTNLMQKMGVHVTIPHPNKMGESKFGLLLCIEPTLLILLPQELMLNPKMENYDSDPNPLIVLKAKFEHLKIVCYNSRVQKYFPNWSIVENCKPEIYNVFSAKLEDLSQTSARLAIARDDFEETAIVEIGKLACFPKPGQCQSPRPAINELNSVLGLNVESPELTATNTPLPGLSEGHLGLAKITSAVSHQFTVPQYTLPQNSLIPVPRYEDDPVGFELYKSRLKQTTKSTACIHSQVFWEKVFETLTCLHTSSTEEVGA